jgi:hypothetical protein
LEVIAPKSAETGQTKVVRAKTETLDENKLRKSRSHDAVIRVYDDAGNVIETHEHKGDFKKC